MIRSLSSNTERFCDSGNHNPVGASPNNRPAIHDAPQFQRVLAPVTTKFLRLQEIHRSLCKDENKGRHSVKKLARISWHKHCSPCGS